MNNLELPFDRTAGRDPLGDLVAAGNRLAGLLDAALRGRVSAHDIDAALEVWDRARDESGVVV